MWITKDEYDKKLSEIEESNYNIQKQIDAHTSADKSFGITLESLMVLSSHAGQLFESSEVSQKREIINLLLSNCTLKDGKVQYSLRKPFDALVNLTNRLTWLGCISFSRTRDVLDLLSLGSNIQKILSRIQA